MRSPVAIGTSTLPATLASALRFSGGTGSSSQAGRNGAISWAIRTAVEGLKRPCISSISSVSGPMASRTASMSDTEYRVSSWPSSKWPVPNGSIFSAR